MEMRYRYGAHRLTIYRDSYNNGHWNNAPTKMACNSEAVWRNRKQQGLE